METLTGAGKEHRLDVQWALNLVDLRGKKRAKLKASNLVDPSEVNSAERLADMWAALKVHQTDQK